MTSRETDKLLRANGFELVRRTKHTFVYQRGPDFVTTSTTPGDKRNLKHVKSQIKRADRKAP